MTESSTPTNSPNSPSCTWAEALKEFEAKLRELGFKDSVRAYAGKLVHPCGYTVWLGSKTFRYLRKGGDKAAALSGQQIDIRKPIVMENILRQIKGDIR